MLESDFLSFQSCNNFNHPPYLVIHCKKRDMFMFAIKSRLCDQLFFGIICSRSTGFLLKKTRSQFSYAPAMFMTTVLYVPVRLCMFISFPSIDSG